MDINHGFRTRRKMKASIETKTIINNSQDKIKTKSKPNKILADILYRDSMGTQKKAETKELNNLPTGNCSFFVGVTKEGK